MKPSSDATWLLGKNDAGGKQKLTVPRKAPSLHSQGFRELVLQIMGPGKTSLWALVSRCDTKPLYWVQQIYKLEIAQDLGRIYRVIKQLQLL